MCYTLWRIDGEWLGDSKSNPGGKGTVWVLTDHPANIPAPQAAIESSGFGPFISIDSIRQADTPELASGYGVDQADRTVNQTGEELPEHVAGKIGLLLAALAKAQNSLPRVDARVWRIHRDGEGEPWRQERLFHVLVFADSWAKRVSIDLSEWIERVRDHEGTLTVVWRKHPGEFGLGLLNAAWEHVSECSVEHEFLSGEPTVCKL